MLRKVTIIVSVIVLAWWVRGGDPQTLKRDILELSNGSTSFAPEGGDGGRSDWGAS